MQQLSQWLIQWVCLNEGCIISGIVFVKNSRFSKLPLLKMQVIINGAVGSNQ